MACMGNMEAMDKGKELYSEIIKSNKLNHLFEIESQYFKQLKYIVSYKSNYMDIALVIEK